MSSWTPVIYQPASEELVLKRSAMDLILQPHTHLPLSAADTVDALYQQLLLQIPDFSFTIEVDILGAHRVTIHFKGVDIDVADIPY